MTVTKESFGLIQERYDKIQKLLKEVDPEATPYASKYQARRKLLDLQKTVSELHSNTPETSRKLNGILAILKYQLGAVSADVDETSTGRQYLLECVELIGDKGSSPEFVLVAQMAYNQLAILYGESEPEKALEFVEKAEDCYKGVREKKDIFDFAELFVADGVVDGVRGTKVLEENYTLTLFYKAQIFGALKDALKSSVYCHMTLQRQLECGEIDSVDWALNAATLSQFFMEKNGFNQAKHHLSASQYVLDEYEKKLDEINEQTADYEAKVENFKHRSADVARCWVKYGLNLLGVSKERLMKEEEIPIFSVYYKEELEKLNLTIQDLTFPSLDLNSYENMVTDQFLLTSEDARKVFTFTQKWLTKASQYYSLENLASDYVEIQQDLNQAYAKLSFFEEDPETQAKLHKRRADLLENVLNSINPSYYIQYCRQLWFELAETYSEILDIKREKLRESNSRPTPHALTKINTLVEKSIQHYRNFIASFKNLATDKLPNAIPEDFEKAFLQAHLHVAALCERYIVLDKAGKLKRVRESFDAYKAVVEYCERNAKAAEMLKQEYSMCKEMVDLLPYKIAKLEAP